MEKQYSLKDLVTMKKPHPCGTNEWQIIRMGMDIRLKCTQCGRSVLLTRREFERSLKKVVGSVDENDESK